MSFRRSVTTLGSGGRDSHPFAKGAKEWGTLFSGSADKPRKPERQCFGSKGTLTSMVVLALAGAYFHFWTAEAADSPRIGLPPRTSTCSTAPFGATTTFRRTVPPM